MDNRKNNEQDDIFGWIIIFICFFAFWPLGVYLLLAKLGVFGKAKKYASRNRYGNSGLEERFNIYSRCAGSRASVPLSDMAAAAGVSYETAVREVQQMLGTGRFGNEAYINYMTKTLVLHAADNSPKNAAGNKGRTHTAEPVAEPVTAKPLKYASALRTLLLVGGIGLLATGILVLFAWLLEPYELSLIIVGLFFSVGGLAALGVRSSLKKRARRMPAYLAAAHGHKSIELSVLAQAAGVSESTAQRDIEIMLDKGMFGPDAFFSAGGRLLVLTADGFTKNETPAPEPDSGEDVYTSILREIREVNDAIPDEAVSERIYRIEEITSKIFDAVREKPEKLPQIKSFMSYYLPTTLKLLRSYSTFEKQGVSGQNISEAKKNIERILDSLVDGFTKQLDQLYKTDAMDISTDINVLESMLKKDGLSDDGAKFTMTM